MSYAAAATTTTTSQHHQQGYANSNTAVNTTATPTASINPFAMCYERAVTPKNEFEKALLAQLVAMGFTDHEEVLHAIRRRVRRNRDKHPNFDPTINVTASVVREDIFTIRKNSQIELEKEEARLMDAARIESEKLREQEAVRDAQALQKTQEEASWKDWLEGEPRNMFPNSWLLRNAKLRKAFEPRIKKNKQMKHKFLELIRIEKKSRQWYLELPRSYFMNHVLTDLLEQADATSQERALDTQLGQLQDHLYKLENQEGGVPRAFLESSDASGQFDAEDDGVKFVGCVVKRKEDVVDLDGR